MPDSILDAIADAQEPVRDGRGQFVRPDVGRTKQRGSILPIPHGRRIRLTEAQMMAEGDQNFTNPLVSHLVIMKDPQIDPRVRLTAAEVISRHMFPTKQTLEIETPDQADETRIQRTRALLSGLGKR